MVAKNFSNTALNTTIASGIGSADTSLVVTSDSGWPAAPFACVLEPGEVTEEVILVGARSGTSFTSLTRGYNGTIAATHGALSEIKHVAIAEDFQEVYTHEANVSNPHTVTVAQLGAATEVDLTLAEADIATNAADIVTNAGNLTTHETNLSHFDTGMGCLWFIATPPSGFIILDGVDKDRTTYADLFALWGETHGVGDGSTTFGIPDTRQGVPMGLADSGTGSLIDESGGAIDHTHTGVDHVHTMGLHAHTLPVHNHGMKSHTHSHNHPSTNTGASSAASTGLNAGTTLNYTAGAATGTNLDPHTHTMAHTHALDLANQVSGAPSDNITNDTNPGPTNSADAGNTNSAGGVGSTGSNNQKYFVAVFIVKT